MNKLIEAVKTFLSGVDYIEQEENANYVVTKEDKELLQDAIDTVVSEVEKPTYTAEYMEAFAEWCSKNAELVADNEWVVYYGEGNTYKATTAQLRELWEQERRAK